MSMHIWWLNLHPDTCNPDETWDTTMLRDLLTGRFGPVPDFGDVICISGRHHYDDVDAINAAIAKYQGVVVIIHSDEESLFPVERLVHPNMRLWVQTPKPGRHNGLTMTSFPVGYTPHTQHPPMPLDDPPNDWGFAGQITNSRREEAAAAMRGMSNNGSALFTAGFTQGYPPDMYASLLHQSKTVPCPSGPVIADCFRIWEALQYGAIPLVDAVLPNGSKSELANDLTWSPMRRIDESWDDLAATVRDVTGDSWLMKTNTHQVWWLAYKKHLAQLLAGDITAVTDRRFNHPGVPVTVLMPTSPVMSHPSTEIIEQTIESVRERLPDAEIIIMVDGVRDEQEHLRHRYETYTRRLLWFANHRWGNVTVNLHSEHRHQVQMTRIALDLVKTNTILFVEHDTPLVGDIDFAGLVKSIELSEFRVARLHHESHILDAHMHLMIGDGPHTMPLFYGDMPVWLTTQWSQRPHLASAFFYKRWLDEWFGPKAISMIEDRMHGAAQERDWDEFQIVIYTPEGDSIQRSTHLDARGEDPKFPMDFDNA